jgi:hypothetical protein
MSNDPIDPRVEIGDVHLKVADIDRAVDFYWLGRTALIRGWWTSGCGVMGPGGCRSAGGKWRLWPHTRGPTPSEA